jgi:hypothetical protein
MTETEKQYAQLLSSDSGYRMAREVMKKNAWGCSKYAGNSPECPRLEVP